MELLKNEYIFWSVLMAANVFMFLLNALINLFWSKQYKLKSLKISSLDIKTSLITLGVNVIVAIPGYYLFLGGKITFNQQGFLVDLVLLIFLFDVVMYILHYAFHIIWPFKKIHQHHHTHTYFNEFSLYVMNPLEALFFGLLLTLIAFVFNLNIYSFLLFIFFNWLYGVVAHLNTKSEKTPLFFGNSSFHKKHHALSNCNYGFYTVVWDKLFRTTS
ncbi:hypothetical protein MNBD_BACTEROID06-254 [hydrothermal vent metagenome]|uniref:Fatty acid hydroxylase domain-containing protein n=1 Tax=hydrothermal vent metagenome TaxID=652676 RepID=A0A3B0U7E0_9ZZZZ